MLIAFAYLQKAEQKKEEEAKVRQRQERARERRLKAKSVTWNLLIKWIDRILSLGILSLELVRKNLNVKIPTASWTYLKIISSIMLCMMDMEMSEDRY